MPEWLDWDDPADRLLSDSPTNCQKITPVGIDRITLWFRIRDPEYANYDDDRFGANVHVMVKDCRAGIDFNPSRILYPDSIDLAPLALARLAVELVWSTIVQHYVTPSVSLDHADLTRIDLARNVFGATDPNAIFEGLRRYPRKRGAVTDVYTNERGVDSGITFGPKSARMNVYRKDTDPKALGIVPANTLRVELQLRRGAPKRAGVPTYSSLTPDRIESIFQTRWAWAGLDVPILSGVNLLAVIDTDLTLGSDTIKANLYRGLSRLAQGLGPPEQAPRKRRVRDWIECHGHPIFDTPTAGGIIVQTFDLATATVITTHPALPESAEVAATKEARTIETALCVPSTIDSHKSVADLLLHLVETSTWDEPTPPQIRDWGASLEAEIDRLAADLDQAMADWADASAEVLDGELDALAHQS